MAISPRAALPLSLFCSVVQEPAPCVCGDSRQLPKDIHLWSVLPELTTRSRSRRWSLFYMELFQERNFLEMSKKNSSVLANSGKDEEVVWRPVSINDCGLLFLPIFGNPRFRVHFPLNYIFKGSH